jgi:hypothetical protein
MPDKIVYDPEVFNQLGPQSVNGEGLAAAGLYLISVVFNFAVWRICLIIIDRHFILQKKQIEHPDSFMRLSFSRVIRC